MDESVPFSYDQVPYEGQPAWRMQPDRLAMLGRLMGLMPPDIGRARVLELGCASGENLVPLAYAWPEAEFVGVDLSRAQVEAGQKLIARMGLGNVRVLQADIMDVGGELGAFDYIVCHGVYSWVPPAVQEKILAICAGQLTEHGLAAVSYNVYPGWLAKRVARDLMRYHAQFFEDPQQRLGEARSVLAFVAAATPFQKETYGEGLKHMVATLKERGDSYVYHEYLEEFNLPVYFHEFCARLAQHGLNYVGDSGTLCTLPATTAPQVYKALEPFESDYVRWEQYSDFLRQRAFRWSVVTRQPVPAERKPRVAALEGLLLLAEPGAEVTSARQNNDVADESQMTFRNPDGDVMSTRHALVKAALAALIEQRPRAFTLDELHAEVARRIAGRPDAPADAQSWREALAEIVLQVVWNGMIEASSARAPYVMTSSARPQASLMARVWSETFLTVPSLRHRMVDLKDLQAARLLRAMDGTRTVEELAALWPEGSEEEKLTTVRGALAEAGQQALLEA